MKPSAADRVAHLLDAIADIDQLLEGKTVDFIKTDKFAKAAYERLLEIVSEASRHIPPTLKEQASHIPWRAIADIGNRVRHGYDTLSIDRLWRIRESGELAELRAAILKMKMSEDRK
jgi:uncharacterized protein with HEPN domain